MWQAKSLIFAPNTTGKVHLGTALVLWLTAREARERGLRFLIRFDDWPNAAATAWKDVADPLYGTISERMYQTTWASTINTCDILGIRPDATFRWSQRTARYWQAIHLLARNGKASRWKTEPWGSGRYNIWDVQNYVLTDAPRIHDLIRGACPQLIYGLALRHAPSSCLSAAVDAVDFDTPFHIRAHDLIDDAYVEKKIFGALRDPLHVPEDRPDLAYAHIPVICDENGDELHKSEGVEDAYLFEKWSKQFRTRRRIRGQLESLVLPAGAEYKLENILPEAHSVFITPTGKRVGGFPG